jgi:FAD/FMN-containing dehydrogenase
VSTTTEALEHTFAGEIVRPDHPGYDELRKVFNGMIDRRPALIARCTGPADVIAAVNHARDNGLALSVRAGGHGVTGDAVCDAGVCIDLRPMTGIRVDPRRRTAHVQAGASWGQLDRETQQFGLAVTGGRVPDTGVAGLTLGSGSGWLERKLGLTCDSLRSIDLVTADGRLLVASESENAELFWGLRGGGGNFGVVTSFEFALHPVGPLVVGGMMLHPGARARDVTRHFRDFMATAPEEVGAGLAFISAPDAPFVPAFARGLPMVGMIVCYVGPVERAEEVLRPLRAFGPPIKDFVGPMPYVAVQKLLEPGSLHGKENYWKAHFLADLPDDAVDVLVEYSQRVPSTLTQAVLMPLGGAIARVDEDAMAFGQRAAAWNLHILSMWEDPADAARQVAWTRDFHAAMRPYATGGAYLNFIGNEGNERVRAAFGPEKYARLVELKRRYDPENLFRLNQNIPPDAPAHSHPGQEEGT